MANWIFMIEVDGKLVSRHRMFPKSKHDVHKHAVRRLPYNAERWEAEKHD